MCHFWAANPHFARHDAQEPCRPYKSSSKASNATELSFQASESQKDFQNELFKRFHKIGFEAKKENNSKITYSIKKNNLKYVQGVVGLNDKR